MSDTPEPMPALTQPPSRVPETPTAARPLQPATWGWLVALVGWSCVLAFYDLGGGAAFEPIDCWVAQTAREMQAANEWLVPRFSDELRMQKSPGAYWAVMAASWLRGTPVDTISARLPNAIAGILLVVTIFWLTLRIAGDRAAIFGGFAAASSVLVLWWSHRAASDLGLTTFTTISLAAFWGAIECKHPGLKRGALWLVAYFAAGFGMLYKMPMPLVVVGMPAFLYVLLRNRWRALASWWHLVGLALFLLPWVPWAIAVIQTEPVALAKWKVEFWDRFTGDLPNVEGQRAWYFHFLYIAPAIIYCLPYSASLPGAIWRAIHGDKGETGSATNRDGQWFLLIWVISHFVFFTAAAGKEYRYFLPAIPALLVLLGAELSAFFSPQRRSVPHLDRLGLLAVWIGMPVGFGAAAFGVHYWYRKVGVLEDFDWPEVLTPYIVTALIFTLGASLAAWLYVKRREHASFAALVGTMWLTWLWIWPNVLPIFVSQRPFIDFAEQLRMQVDLDLRPYIRQIGSQDSRIIWYSDVRFPRLIDQLDLLEMQGGNRSLELEREIYGEEIITRLAGHDPILLVASRPHYVDLLVEAPPRLAEEGRAMPPAHLWLQTRHGPKPRHFVLFGNQPPPWPESELTPPSDRLDAARSAEPATPGIVSDSPPLIEAPTEEAATQPATQDATPD